MNEPEKQTSHIHETQVKHSVPNPKHRRKRHHFLAAWLRSPKGIGALLPSSRSLARAMVAQIDTSVPGMIIELGAGTGVMTHALLEAGIPPERLIILERDQMLHDVLAAQFPGLTVLCEDAVNLDKILAKHGSSEVCGIISSLPFLTIPKDIGQAIQVQMAKIIGKAGVIVQFTYGMQSPITKPQLQKLGLVSKRCKIVVANVPPAHVWVYRQNA
jgi:phosphatidylethanolamine/phosphatidyl-N-methylethanolamine N-methyltransferase